MYHVHVHSIRGAATCYMNRSLDEWCMDGYTELDCLECGCMDVILNWVAYVWVYVCDKELDGFDVGVWTC